MASDPRKVIEKTTTREFDKKGRVRSEVIVETEKWVRDTPTWAWPTLTTGSNTSVTRHI